MLTREDRNAIDGLFERLAEAERTSAPRDAEAEALIRQKITRQPKAPYYLAQTVVVQQEALNEAERRIEKLEGQLNGGDRRLSRRGGPWDAPQPGYGYGGGGFLAGAAQTALGVAGGVLLGSMIGSIFSSGSAQAAEPADQSAGDADAGNDDAGANDFGGSDGGDGGFDMGGDF